jgi:hypothetical protein
MQIRRGEGFPGDQGTPVRGGGGAGDLEMSIGSGGKCGCPRKASPTPDKTAHGYSDRIIRPETG